MAFKRFTRVAKRRFNGKHICIDKRGVIYFPSSISLPSQTYELLYDEDTGKIGLDFGQKMASRKIYGRSRVTSIRVLTNFYKISVPTRCFFEWEGSILTLKPEQGE